MFAIDQLALINKDVISAIQSEREEYKKYYDVLCDTLVGVKAIFDINKTDTDIVVDIYTEDAVKLAYLVSNKLCDAAEASLKTEEPIVVRMRSIVPHRKLVILLNVRTFVTIFGLDTGHFSIINPPTFKDANVELQKLLTFGVGGVGNTHSNKYQDLHELSPELRLLDLYRTLHSPADSDIWEPSLAIEAVSFQYLRERMQSGEVLATGSAEEESKLDMFAERTPTQPTADYVGGGVGEADSVKDQIAAEILKHVIVDSTSCCLVGDHAYKVVSGNSIDNNRVQIISSDVESDAGKIQRVVEALIPGSKVAWSTRPFKILQDYRLRRTTIRVTVSAHGSRADSSNVDNYEIAYMYNSAEYDLVPVHKSVDASKKQILPIGNIFVLMRFLMIDYYIVKIKLTEKVLVPQLAKKRMESILSKVLYLRQKLADNNNVRTAEVLPGVGDANCNSYYTMFPACDDSYMGVYQSEELYIKNIGKDAKIYDYYPYEHKKSKGSYKELV